MDIESELNRLNQYAEWGGESWLKMTKKAIEKLPSLDLHGKKVLDFGCRYGLMSVFFARLGAEVVGVDINAEPLETARKNAEDNGVGSQISFQQLDGDDDLMVKNGPFDIIFSKSVLVVVPDIHKQLDLFRKILTDDGICMCVENGVGIWPIEHIRRFRHRKWDYNKANFFNSETIRLFCEVFDEVDTETNIIPPIYTVVARKS